MAQRHAADRAQRQPKDLVVISRERSGLYDVVQRLGEFSGVEIRIDSRWQERRRVSHIPRAEERRQGDRRLHEVGGQLQTDGWVFIPAADRH